MTTYRTFDDVPLDPFADFELEAADRANAAKRAACRKERKRKKKNLPPEIIILSLTISITFYPQ